MKEIRELDIKLSDVGWDKSDGKSFNVWGLVDFPPELLEYISNYKGTPITKLNEFGEPVTKISKKASIWTAYDEQIYNQLDQGKEVSYLPKISATFKSSFSKYTAIAENIGMKLATVLDMPTSYNYLVSFDPQKHPQITSNYPNPTKINQLYPYGIVSIDFLQVQKKHNPTKTKDIYFDEYGIKLNIDVEDKIDGDQLITFEDALRKYKITSNNIDGSENLIENWINVVDEMAKRELTDVPRERLNRVIDHIHSRIARSFLLKDAILGDCDFTAYNGGVVLNHSTRKLRYAPNYDYGESFNGLIQNKLEYDPYYGMTKEQFDALPKSIRDKILSTDKFKANQSVQEIAQKWASSTSKQNFYYVINNFPQASNEFFKNLDKFVENNGVETLISKYTTLTCNGTPLLSKEEAEDFKTYLSARIEHASSLYRENLQTRNWEQ